MAVSAGKEKIGSKVILEELSKINASDIMVPRSGVVFINKNSSFTDIIDIVINDGHSRFPVYSNKIDNIIGILYIKDLLKFFKTIEVDFDITRILRKPLFISENKKTSELLSEFIDERVHIAIVVNEYGTVLGIISLEDILEEIVGDISDEFDKEKNVQNFIQLNKDEYKIFPKMPLVDFNNMFKTRINSDDYETIGGFIIDRFGYVPKENETLKYGNLYFQITVVEGSRIKEIFLKKT